ncbi:hypothetical protein VNO77_29942 [Canavalia gladiata]|uniref:Uncharacterized protein n=1 Tax=Canavalia gladiata TaxID=3824 RepID=A0AAN9KPV6_CANGL
MGTGRAAAEEEDVVGGQSAKAPESEGNLLVVATTEVGVYGNVGVIGGVGSCGRERLINSRRRGFDGVKREGKTNNFFSASAAATAPASAPPAIVATTTTVTLAFSTPTSTFGFSVSSGGSSHQSAELPVNEKMQ